MNLISCLFFFSNDLQRRKTFCQKNLIVYVDAIFLLKSFKNHDFLNFANIIYGKSFNNFAYNRAIFLKFVIRRGKPSLFFLYDFSCCFCVNTRI